MTARAYRCPTCRARPGRSCVTSSGRATVDYHQARVWASELARTETGAPKRRPGHHVSVSATTYAQLNGIAAARNIRISSLLEQAIHPALGLPVSAPRRPARKHHLR